MCNKDLNKTSIQLISKMCGLNVIRKIRVGLEELIRIIIIIMMMMIITTTIMTIIINKY